MIDMIARLADRISELAILVAKLSDRVAELESGQDGFGDDSIPGVDLAGNPVKFG